MFGIVPRIELTTPALSEEPAVFLCQAMERTNSHVFHHHHHHVFLAAKKSAREFQVRHSEGQCRLDVFQAPGGTLDHVQNHGGSELRDPRRGDIGCSRWVSYFYRLFLPFFIRAHTG